MEHYFDFDPQLPALPLAFDLDAVAQLFEAYWLEQAATAHSNGAVKVCRLHNTKYQPSVRCMTTYELLVDQPGAVSRPTLGVVEISPAGVRPRLFNHDPQLPWLAYAVNPARMRKRFAALLKNETGMVAIEACAITPVRYKPGSHCMLRYDLLTLSGQQALFGKLLAQDGHRLMTTLTTLYQASQAAPEMPRILRPLAYWAEAHLLIQPGVAGQTELHSLAFDTTQAGTIREQWMHTAGVRLAALHACAVVNGRRRTFEDDLRELHDYTAPMAQVAPALATRFEAIIAALANLAHGQAEMAPVASHGALRTDQFMIEDSDLVLIDLDSFCWANPARDVGNFLAYLIWKAIRQPQHAAFIERARRAFLKGYMASRPTLDLRWLALYQAASMLKIVGRRFQSLTYPEWPLVPQLLDAALATLKQKSAVNLIVEVENLCL